MKKRQPFLKAGRGAGGVALVTDTGLVCARSLRVGHFSCEQSAELALRKASGCICTSSVEKLQPPEPPWESESFLKCLLPW